MYMVEAPFGVWLTGPAALLEQLVYNTVMAAGGLPE